MDKEEKLRKERERIRIASQKTRQKRREEEITLRTENEQMKRERSSLISTLKDLEETLERLQARIAEKDEAHSENELLNWELQQYREFGTACVMIGEQFSVDQREPSSEVDLQKDILQQVTKSGGEMSDLQAERVLSQSLEDDGRWKPLLFDTLIEQLHSCAQGRYRVNEDGSCDWQFSFCVPHQQNRAAFFAEKYRNLWHDPRPMMSIFGRSGPWFYRMEDNVVEQLSSYGNTKLQRIKHGGSDQSWVFVLTAKDADNVARSTLIPSSAQLSPLLSYDRHSQKEAQQKNSSSATPPVVETSRVGLVECWTGTRASIMLDSSLSSRGNCVKGKFLESFRVWNEEIYSSDERIAGPGIRGVCIMSATSDFAKETFGDQGFGMLFSFEENKVAIAYQTFIDFIACSMGLDQIPLPR